MNAYKGGHMHRRKHTFGWKWPLLFPVRGALPPRQLSQGRSEHSSHFPKATDGLPEAGACLGPWDLGTSGPGMKPALALRSPEGPARRETLEGLLLSQALCP